MRLIKLFSFLFFISGNFIFSQVKFAPDSGCYIGAFILYDKTANADIKTFETMTGKKHTGYLTYVGYGSSFPKAWIEDCKTNNAFAQIGYEPMDGLEAVTDTEYLHNFAKEANKSGIPIFIRWASEMNIFGDNPWATGKPTLYIEKFRLVSRIFKEEAPNVIMVWAPNWAPNNIGDSTSSIDPYYPGNDFVDWVGVDFYQWGPNCPYDRGVTDPRDQLRYVYNKYSAIPFNKPVFICEMGVSHFDYWGNTPTDAYQYCIDGMNKIYQHLKPEFPKVKAVFWFDVDSHTSNKANFQLTDDARVLNNYKNVISDSYYLSEIKSNLPKIEILNFKDSSIIRNKTSFNLDIKSDYPIQSVKLFLNSVFYNEKLNLPYTFDFDPSKFPDGNYEIKILVNTTSGINNIKRYYITIDNNNDYFEQVIDNIPGAFFSITGAWWVSESQPDYYGTNFYHVIGSGNGSAIANWIFNLPNPGNYEVYAWWSEHSNRASNAPYKISTGTKDTIIKVNQKTNGGKWNLLGKFNFSNTDANISLSNNADGYVIADAVKIFRNESLVTNNILSNKTLPDKIDLRQNYPNPFNPVTKIKFSASSKDIVSLKIYDVLGRLIKEVHEFSFFNNEGEYEFDGSKLSGGIYFYQLSYGKKSLTKSMVLLK
jgi:hypothetical protein